MGHEKTKYKNRGFGVRAVVNVEACVGSEKFTPKLVSKSGKLCTSVISSYPN